MFIRTVRSSLVLIILMPGLGACQWRKETTPANDLISASTAVEGQVSTKTPPSQFSCAFTGKIAEKYAIRMDLERDGQKLKGTYFYDRPGAMRVAMKYIGLEGTIDQGGQTVLTETVYDKEAGVEKKTGQFKGKLVVIETSGASFMRLSGAWTRARDNQTLPFAVEEMRFDLGAKMSLSRSGKQENARTSNYQIETNLPKLAGADDARAERFNAAINNLIENETAEFKKLVDEMARETAGKEPARAKDAPKSTMEIEHSITFADSDLVSILLSFYSYAGGAHPSATTKSLNYDLKTNQPINLGDLFKPDSNYLKVISDYCTSELIKIKVGDPEWIKNGAGPKLENFKSWNLTQTGLMITFDAYQVASYAEGPNEVVVPYSLLKPVIRGDGPLPRFVK